jgi:opacity protein-like surface antigen
MMTGTLMLLASSVDAARNNGWSLGPGVNNIGDSDISVTNGVISVGYRSSDAFAYELSIGGGGSTTWDGVDLDVDYFAHQRFKFGDRSRNFYYYGSVGYATFQIEASSGYRSATADGDGFTAGIGMETVLSRNWLFNLAYDRGFNDLEDADIFSLKFRYLF